MPPRVRPWKDFVKLPLQGHLWLIVAAIIVGVSQLVMTNAYRTLPVSRGSSIQMLLPLVTAAGAFFFFGERFTGLELAGAALTLFATWRVAAGPKRRPEPVISPSNPSNTVQFPDLPKP